MRAWSRILGIAVVAVACASLAGGQAPFQPGGFGKGKGPDRFTLAQNPQVKGELKLTDQQLEKLHVAALKALAEILDEKQFARLREIYLQNRGNSVYLEPDVKKDLKITDDQAAKIKAALDTQAKEMQAMVEGGGFDFERMQELQKTATDTVQGVLTADQKTAWTKLTGEPFQMGFFKGKKGGGD
jgi:Spy/CpxP family protein refolding chaperone